MQEMQVNADVAVAAETSTPNNFLIKSDLISFLLGMLRSAETSIPNTVLQYLEIHSFHDLKSTNPSIFL